MFFYTNETYIDAIEKKKIGVLRALLVGIIGSDPTFATTEYKEARQYISDQSRAMHGIELMIEETYSLQEGEHEKEPQEWDEAYYQMQLVWLRDNFAINERLPKIKEIGNVVYKNKKTMGKLKREKKNTPSRRQVERVSNRTVKKKTGNDSSDKQSSKKRRWWPGIVVIVAVVFLGCKFFF